MVCRSQRQQPRPPDQRRTLSGNQHPPSSPQDTVDAIHYGTKRCHAWTDGSFREAAGFGWISHQRRQRRRPHHRRRTRISGANKLPSMQNWRQLRKPSPGSWRGQGKMAAHDHPLRLDECHRQSGHTGAGPGQTTACNIRKMVRGLREPEPLTSSGSKVTKAPRQRESRRPRGQSSRETRLLQRHVDGSPQTPDLRTVPQRQRRPGTKRRNTTGRKRYPHLPRRSRAWTT
jgi:hypothetical protein